MVFIGSDNLDWRLLISLLQVRACLKDEASSPGVLRC